MTSSAFLAEVHRLLAPQTYLEIGVANGSSLHLSRCRSIGVDPAFEIRREIACDVALYRETSDDFFRRPEPLAHLGTRPIDLAFIDGLHLFEFALRDFMNVERNTHSCGTIIIDGVLPRDVREAARKRRSAPWAGDVFRLGQVFNAYRPDLQWRFVDTDPTGLIIVFGADPDNRELERHYDEILHQVVTDDPQAIPESILSRAVAVDPAAVLGPGLWEALALLRRADAALAQVQGYLRGALPPAPDPGPVTVRGPYKQRRRPATDGMLRPSATMRTLWSALPKSWRNQVIELARNAGA
jgi:hypothetical protein